MDIINKLDMYLTEAVTEDFKKVSKVINSIKTKHHAIAADKMINNLKKSGELSLAEYWTLKHQLETAVADNKLSVVIEV